MFDLIIFKYLFCLMITFRRLIEIDSNWILFVFFEWSDRMKIIDHSWSFCSRRNWIFRVCSIFFFVVKKRSYSFDWTLRSDSQSKWNHALMMFLLSAHSAFSTMLSFLKLVQFSTTSSFSTRCRFIFESLMKSSMISSRLFKFYYYCIRFYLKN
jgi:hypothetical protein